MKPVASVTRVAACGLSVREGPWGFARQHARAIDAHWERRMAANPSFFNGTILMLANNAVDADGFTGVFQCVEFKEFLYWRETFEPEAGLRDGFGSALLRSNEGYVLIGRQCAGHLNAGLSYPPGGFIDSRDVRPGGVVDIDASIEREIAEETGLVPGLFTPEPGYLVTRAGALVSIAREYRSQLPAAELTERARHHLAADPDAELDAILVVRGPQDMDVPMPAYARALLEFVFARNAG